MRLPEDPEARQAIAVAMRRLVSRSRLTGELRSELEKRGFGGMAIEATLAFLSENRLMDDALVAQALVGERSGRQSVGREGMANRLRQRGASEDLIESTLADWDEEAERGALRAALDSRCWRPGDRNRAGRFLASRGFDPDQIESELDRRFRERSD